MQEKKKSKRMKKCFKVDCNGEVVRGEGEFGRCDRCGTIYQFDETRYHYAKNEKEIAAYATAKKFVITEKVMNEVRKTLKEYIEDIEKMPGCLREIHSGRIRQVLYNFDTGLCLAKPVGKEE